MAEQGGGSAWDHQASPFPELGSERGRWLLSGSPLSGTKHFWGREDGPTERGRKEYIKQANNF